MTILHRDARSKFDPAMRREVVQELTAAGMSTRAIAPVVGASFKTVARDAARVSGDTPQTPGGERSHGETDTSTAAGTRQEQAAATHPSVTGIDGKTYSGVRPPDQTCTSKKAAPPGGGTPRRGPDPNTLR